MSTKRRQFAAFSRLLHWTMAAMVLTMLCIGVAMVASLANYHVLVSIHRPLGIAILILVVVRFVNRQLTTLPPFPATMSRAGRLAATEGAMEHSATRGSTHRGTIAGKMRNTSRQARTSRAAMTTVRSPFSGCGPVLVAVRTKTSRKNRAGGYAATLRSRPLRLTRR